ncbi:MAG: hypothetical protein ACXWV4_05880 [Flavitalea sp.]
MDQKSLVRSLLPLTLIFIFTNGFFIAGKTLLEKWNISQSVVLVGNLILLLATIVSFVMYWKSLQNDKVQVFLRMIYGGMFIKMMICLFTALIYIMIVQKGVNKGGIFVCMGLYFLYTFVEMSILMKVSKLKKNG